ncbi:MAG: hypothetical protein EpisKO_00450 [Epibacterium sp.]
MIDLNKALYQTRALRLAKASSLFEVGPLQSELPDASYVLRINVHLARQFAQDERKVPDSAVAAISGKGAIDRRAEVLLFDSWLNQQFSSGGIYASGRKPDRRTTVQCVAAAIFWMRQAKKRDAHGFKQPGRQSRTRGLTKTDLSEAWNFLFDDMQPVKAFDARMRTLGKALPRLVSDLKAGKVSLAGRKVSKCSWIEQLARELLVEPQRDQTDFAPQPVDEQSSNPADVSPFEIPLRYPSDEKRDEYRGKASKSENPTTLHYTASAVEPCSQGGKNRVDRVGKVVLRPDLEIRRDYHVEALVDRMVFLVHINSSTSGDNLSQRLKVGLGAAPYVQDLSKGRVRERWGAPYPPTSAVQFRGHHFAILMQDPTPKRVSTALDIIHSSYAIVGPVELHLLEISVDFYPKAHFPESEALRLREQMVGVLHRHQWCPHSHLLRHGPAKPRLVDARQIFDGHVGQKRLFQVANSRHLDSDADLSMTAVRQRILSPSKPEDIFLNATLSRGAKDSEFLISAQHKIADNRNHATGTADLLDEKKRRARIEVTISGRKALKERGAILAGDLGGVSYRSLTQPFLKFWLPEIFPTQDEFDDARAQLQTRGVYGIELRTRARALEARDALKRGKQPLPRKNDREGFGLAPWTEMNMVVGERLDELSRRWKGFSWP